jgi:hypothetical protein
MPQTRRAKPAGKTALDRLQSSIEGAESALKDLRGDVSRDTRERLTDVATTLKSARRSVIRSRQRIVKDLEAQIEQRLAKGKKRPASKRGAKAARARTTRSRKAAAAKSTAKRRTKTASRSKAAAKPRAKRAAKKT